MTLGRGWRRVFRLPSRTARIVEQDVNDELDFHLAMRAEKLRTSGMTEERAQHAALSRFGDPDRVRDECIDIDTQFAREVRVMEWLASVRSDIRLAYRALRLRPAFTAVATITLALGIGATSAMFSLVDGILLRPLPYPQPERLVSMIQSYPEKGLDRWVLSQENLAMYRDQTRAFSSFAGYNRRGITLFADGRPERLNSVRVTGDFFTVMGVNAALGRVFTREEDTPGTNDVALLSHGFWESRFAGDRSVIGKTLELDGKPTRVVGVMPEGFAFPRADVQVFLPLGLDPSRRFGWFITGVGRLAPGASVEQAERETTALMWNWAKGQTGLLASTGFDIRNTQMKTLVVPLHTAVTGDVARPLAVLQAAVVMILLIAVGNVAMLLSGRASARSREITLRIALGATALRVIRQLLTESVALASLGGLLGVAMAYGLVHTFAHSGAVSLPRIGEVGVSWRVLAFSLAVSLVSGILFGLSPALHLARQRLVDGLTGQKESAHGAARRLNAVLVASQLALSVVLLVSAGLVLKSFQHLLATDLGFDAVGVTSVALPLPQQKYSAEAQTVAATTQILERVRAIPGVASAALTTSLPYSGGVNTDGYLVEGHTVPGTGMETQTVQLQVSPAFFATLKMRLLYGRDISASDRIGSPAVVVVDDEFAHRYWKGADALGKRMRLTGDTTWFTIVGVVGSVRDEDIASALRPHSYFAFAQAPNPRPTLALRTTGDPAPVIAAVRGAVAQLEPGVPLDNIRPLTEFIRSALDNRRLTEMLLAGFALLAMSLAAVGIYGVMSLYVSNRQREFGIRLAIGADPRALLRLVLKEGLVLAMVGVGLGVTGALFATRWVRSLLYDVSPTDPTVFITLAGTLLVVAIASCYLPARRASKSDPLAALRAE